MHNCFKSKENGSELMEHCPMCETETEHSVLHSHNNDFLIKCDECGNIQTISLEKPIPVRTIVSTESTSQKCELMLPKHYEIVLNEKIEVDSHSFLITKIETSEGSKKKAIAKETKTLWLKSYDYIVLRLAIKMKKGLVKSENIAVDPEEEFTVGDILTVESKKYQIYAIRTTTKTRKHGSATATDIKTLYCQFD